MPSISELAIVHGRPGAIAANVANAAALAAFTRFPGRIRDIDERDFGKFVRQVDTGQLWCLTNWSPITWTPITGSGVDPETLTNAINDALGTILNGYVKRDGSLAMTGILNFGLNQATALATATHDTDAIPLKQMNDRFDALSIDDLQPSFTITSFAPTVSTLVERGTTILGMGATASYSRAATSAAVTEALGGSVGGDTLAGGWSAMSSPFSTASRSGSVTRGGTDLGANPTLTATLTASSGPTRTASWAITWASRQYWGVGVAGGLTGAQVAALPNYQLSAGKVASFTVSPSAQKVYYALPKQLGTALMYLAGFEAAFNSPTEVAVTSNGVTRTYYLYESTYTLTGTGLVFSIT